MDNRYVSYEYSVRMPGLDDYFLLDPNKETKSKITENR